MCPFLRCCGVKVQRCRDAFRRGERVGVGGRWQDTLKSRICRCGREICGVYKTISAVRSVSITVELVAL